ncbi:IS110 family transposase [Bradyrhizobium sp. CSS354]|uniref:IS110 family transposase n=1 Tax=Bradyrhizobium sp. CSS354 TaxID=2699172 RepID=UPI0023AF7FCA|nr:IS110 family transposase [Bradyrhizobium sp. CSS354]MDE5464882.1 IS110 family transposase [Bradyrhizobium sp. CSS354]
MEFYAGLDVSLEATNSCAVGGDGNVGRKAKLETNPDAIELFLAKWGIHLKRVGLEAFSSSAWLFTALAEKGLPMICRETRHAKAALNATLNKTRRNDVEGVAQMMRAGWFRVVLVKSESAQTLRALLVGRKTMLGKVLDLENMIRGLLRPFGLKVSEISVGRFDARVRDILAGKKESEAIVAPLLEARSAMRQRLAKLHRVAPTFDATVDDPARFKKSTNVGARFGLTPRRYQSGQTDRIGNISKCGDELTRAMLYEAAIAILTRIPKNFKLRLWGLRLARKKGLKRAATAVARALAVLLHKIWIDGTTFRFGAGGKRGRVAAAM